MRHARSCCQVLTLWLVLGALLWPLPGGGQQWVVDLRVAELGEDPMRLRFGVWPGATDGTDWDLGEEQSPPFPPGNMRHAAFVGPGLGTGMPTDLRASSTTMEHVLTLRVQWTGRVPLVLSWDPDQIAAFTASARIADPFGGTMVAADMAATGELQLNNPALDQLQIAFVARAVTVDPPATRLEWVEPTEVTLRSGAPVPAVVVRAMHDFGGVAVGFDQPVGLSCSGVWGGQLGGTLERLPVAGVVRFDDVVYQAKRDGDAVDLHAQAGDLHVSHFFAVDVVATQLRFAATYGRDPDGTIVPAPVVEAVDASGLLDRNYGGTIALSVPGGPGFLQGTTVATAVAGVARFPGAALQAAADAVVVLEARDDPGVLAPARMEVGAGLVPDPPEPAGPLIAIADTPGPLATGDDGQPGVGDGAGAGAGTAVEVADGAGAAGSDDAGPRATAVATGAAAGLPGGFRLLGVRPNPANPSAAVVVDLPASAAVRVVVYDMLGRVVRQVGPVAMAAGTARQVRLEVHDLAAGAYVYRLTATSSAARWTATGKMMVLP